jgi:hypothetical protein
MVSPESKEIVNPEPHIMPLDEERLIILHLASRASLSRTTYNIQVGTTKLEGRSKIVHKLRGGKIHQGVLVVHYNVRGRLTVSTTF